MSACKTARTRSKSHTPTSAVGMCLREVRECFGVPSDGTPDAATAWLNAEHKHHETDPRKIPRNVPVFWTGGSHGHGHIAISTGWLGRCWSTDIERPGYFDRVDIALIGGRWGLTLVGWTEDLDGVRVYKP